MIADIAKCVSMEGVVIQAAAFPVTSKSTIVEGFSRFAHFAKTVRGARCSVERNVSVRDGWLGPKRGD